MNQVGTFAFAQLLRVLPRTRITRAVGRVCDMTLPPALSRAVVSAYARAYDVDLSEAAPLNGRGAYASFDEFFTRKLKAGARPDLAAADALCCPADGRLDASGLVHEQGRIVVKGSSYACADLLGCRQAAAEYDGGQFAVIYLSPRDYHRVHSPADAVLTEIRSYPGDLFPVNAVSERHIPQFLVRNRRVAMVLDSESYGQLTLVMVAAMIVGRVTVSGIDARDVPLGIHRPDRSLQRGEELAIFHLGSTAVLFAQAGKCAPFDRKHGPIRLGQALNNSERVDD